MTAEPTRTASSRPGLFLAAYGLGWNLLLPVITVVAHLDNMARKIFDRGCLHRNWRVTERLGLPVVPSLDDESFSNKRETLWCHCASLGEAKGLWGLIRELVANEPLPFHIHLTATTASGLEFLQREGEALRTSESFGKGEGVIGITFGIAPFDHPTTVRRFLKAWRVKAVCLFETELWPNYIGVSADLGIPVSLVSARLSKRALALYRRFPHAAEKVLGRLVWIQAQSDIDGDRFRSLSSCPVSTGFDFKAVHYLRGYSYPTYSYPTYSYPTGAMSSPRTGPHPARLAMVSLHVRELRMLLPELPSLLERFPVAVFPRHLRDLPRFRRLLEPLGFVLHSRDARARNLLVDTMGKVAAILPECHSAFVGGSLIPLGCHNLWEPLLAGLKTYFGPEYGNQEWLAGRLLERGIAEVISEVRQLREWREPGSEVPAACSLMVEGQKESLEAARADFRERIFVTFRDDCRHVAVATQSRERAP